MLCPIYIYIYLYLSIYTYIYTFITVITKLQLLLLTYLSMRVFAQTCHTRSVFFRRVWLRWVSMDTPGCGSWFRVWTVLLEAGGTDKDRGRRIWVVWFRSRSLSVAKSLLKVPFAFTDKLFVLLQRHKQNLFVVQHTGFIQNQRETLSDGHCNMLLD